MSVLQALVLDVTPLTYILSVQSLISDLHERITVSKDKMKEHQQLSVGALFFLCMDENGETTVMIT